MRSHGWANAAAAAHQKAIRHRPFAVTRMTQLDRPAHFDVDHLRLSKFHSVTSLTPCVAVSSRCCVRLSVCRVLATCLSTRHQSVSHRIISVMSAALIWQVEHRAAFQQWTIWCLSTGRRNVIRPSQKSRQHMSVLSPCIASKTTCRPIAVVIAVKAASFQAPVIE